MDSRLQRIGLCLLFLTLALSCCLAQVPITTRLCDQLSAGGYTYNLSSLGTITTDTLLSIPDTVVATIDFCEPADGCEGYFACTTGIDSVVTVLCDAEPTGTFLNPLFPQLGATFGCNYTDADNNTNVLLGFVGLVKHSLKYQSTTQSIPMTHRHTSSALFCMVLLRCGPPEANMAGLYTPTEDGGIQSYNFVVPAEVYCDGSGYAGSS